jgi:hypothetical protein
MEIAENKRKGQKLQCFKCSSCFDNNFKRRHEIAVDEGNEYSLQ